MPAAWMRRQRPQGHRTFQSTAAAWLFERQGGACSLPPPPQGCRAGTHAAAHACSGSCARRPHPRAHADDGVEEATGGLLGGNAGVPVQDPLAAEAVGRAGPASRGCGRTRGSGAAAATSKQGPGGAPVAAPPGAANRTCGRQRGCTALVHAGPNLIHATHLGFASACTETALASARRMSRGKVGSAPTKCAGRPVGMVLCLVGTKSAIGPLGGRSTGCLG